ncbi:MAG: glycosyl transferase [Lachnospiraceae bacterium]|uniref:transglycosylase domain-containing protein n=1 Tax=Parablautia intestinalis TaxID=2320100 RepID=UPI00256ECA7F|nr:transglycosylase domain-containing protein [Parablautia intestinalis]MCI8613654.1 glycosyl transferase [Lachnospiraceae bacterium]
MNYSKKGIHNKQKSLHATSAKLGRKLLLATLNLSLLLVLAVGIIGLCMGLGIFKGVIDSAPSIENVQVTPTGFSTFVYDLEGNQTAKLISQNSNRIPVTQDMIPEDLAHAFVAIEDERFYEHNGIDIKGIFRAAYTGIMNGFHFTEGASTITQQLLKNNVFTDWTSEQGFADSMKRKIQEQYLAIELTKTMSKDDVLLNYMNTINLGQNTLGVQAASLRYFNKSVNSLTLSECAVIAGITQNPSRFNPISHPDDNAARRKKVLGNMLDQGYITQTEYDEAMADDVYSRIQVVNEDAEESMVNTYFVDALTDDVMNDLLAAGYNETQAFTLLYSGGLKIYSTQDPHIQSICDEVFSNEENYPANTRWYLNYALTIKKANGDFENHSTEMYRAHYRELDPSFNLIYDSQEDAYAQIEDYKSFVLGDGDEVFDESINLTPQPQVSITVEDQSTGYVVAMVGGRGAKEGSKTLNRATDTTRQPGSTFKIVAAYAPALDSAGLTLATVVNDAPFNYANGRPVRNWWGDGYRGLNSLRKGIIDSMNIIAVKTLTMITPQLGFDYVKNFGFTTVVDRKEITVNGETQIFSDIQQSLALGGITEGVTNEELNAAYAAIANGGTYIKPKLYTRVVDHDGNVILDNTEPDSRQVIKETTAWLLTSAMMDVVTQGTGSSVNFGNMAIAGKTGTTSDYNDIWFSGYTPYYTATTWAGYDNNTKLRKGDERNVAKKLWRAVMAKIHEDLPSEAFQMPSSGLVQATVCARSGKLPIAGLCDGTLRTEYFAEGTVPTESCDVHYQGMICQYCNLPASEQCPFKVGGVLELTPIEHPNLQQGSATMQQITNADGSVSTVAVPQNQSATCPHNAEFYAQPDALAIEEQQRNEIAAAQAALQQPPADAAPAEGTAPLDDSDGVPTE